MGVAAGPKAVTDGLVFALDPGNIFKSVDSTSNNFLQNGSFADGLGVTYEAGSNPTNTIIELENPGDSNYVLRQNGNQPFNEGVPEYQMNIDGGAQGTLSASTQYVMSGWYATSDDYNGGDTMFHARAFSSSGAHNATGNGIGTLLYSVEVGGLTWEYRYQTISTPSDYSGNFDWYMGYGTTNTTGYRYYTGLKVEEGSFPSLLDLSRNGNDAKVINGTSYSSANGGSLVFDGVDDYINLGSSNTLNFTTAFSVSFWMNNNISTNTLEYFVNRWTYSTGAYRQWSIDSGGSVNRINFRISSDGTDGGQTGIISTNASYSIGWHNICGTWNGSVMSLYVDGVLVAGPTTKTSMVSTPGQSTFIGGGNLGNTLPMSGNIAQVSIYNRALTVSEVKQNYNATKSRFGL